MVQALRLRVNPRQLHRAKNFAINKFDFNAQTNFSMRVSVFH